MIAVGMIFVALIILLVVRQRSIREEITARVRALEPISDLCIRNSYRCAACMKDGLYLPYVLFQETAGLFPSVIQI